MGFGVVVGFFGFRSKLTAEVSAAGVQGLD